MEFKDIIKTRRSTLGLTLDDIARRVGVSGATVSRWESGDIENIRRDKIAKLAEALQVTPAYLMGWENASGEQDLILTALDTAKRLNAPVDVVEAIMENMGWPDATDPEVLKKISVEIERRRLPPNIIPLPKTYSVPLLGNIACGQPILAVEEAEEVVEVPEYIHADFALRCKGDSMINARIFDGDIVYIHKQPEVENGQIAAVRIGEEATLKRVYFNGQRLVLRAANPLYDDLEYEGPTLNDVQILGEAVAFTSMLKK